MNDSTKNEKTANLLQSTSESLGHYLKDVFDLRANVNKEVTVEEIKSNISFRGLQSYILMASIVIASIGLYANSTAVVIGAMLISPLMGPIIGFGYSLAVNDGETLKKSLQNFALMVVLALFISFCFFYFIPTKTLNPELRGRLEPTLLDVMIAATGGFAGIVASSSKNKNINAIAGVAIATALMPPLCTAGYGLAVGLDSIGYKDFNGLTAALNALYLFFINSVFIAISTFLFTKLLRFPMAKYQDAKKRKRTNLYIIGISVLMIIPSVIIFYNIVLESNYNRNLQTFLNDEVIYKDAYLVKESPIVEKTDSLITINISSSGSTIPNEVINNWNYKLQQLPGFGNATLIVHQGMNATALKDQVGSEIMRDLYRQDMYAKDSIINALTHKVSRLSSDSIPFKDVSRELKELYPEMDYFGYSVFNTTDFKSQDAIPTFIVTWNTQKDSTMLNKDLDRIKKYLQTRLKLDTLQFLITQNETLK